MSGSWVLAQRTRRESVHSARSAVISNYDHCWEHSEALSHVVQGQEYFSRTWKVDWKEKGDKHVRRQVFLVRLLDTQEQGQGQMLV